MGSMKTLCQSRSEVLSSLMESVIALYELDIKHPLNSIKI